MKASFVILSYNRKKELLTTIEKTKKLVGDKDGFEIVVVDNNSSDGSAAAVKEQHADVVLIARDKNIGIAGWNDGFAVAKGRYFIVLDDDSHLESGLDEAIYYLNENPGLGILALNVVGGMFDTSNKDEWKHKQACYSFVGCGAIIRREVYEKIGGFAEWLWIYTHEIEYAIRCLDIGYRVEYFEDAHILHRTSVVNRTNKRIQIFSARNEMAILYKYFTRNRFQYIWRVFMNHFKCIKKDGILSGYHAILSGIMFLKMRDQLTHTPVSEEIQRSYIKTFWFYEPVFNNLKKRFNVVK